MEPNTKYWHVPLNKAVTAKAITALTPFGTIDLKPLKNFLTKRKLVQNTQVKEKPSALTEVQTLVYNKISNHNLGELNRMVETLKLKAYSQSTMNTYRHEMMQLLRVIANKKVNDLIPDDLRRYMLFVIEKESIYEFTTNSRINALKFYFEKVLGRERMFIEIPRPKKPLNLPRVLGEMELGQLFTALQNKKHKAILFTAYSAGLRVSEAVKLKLTDIDSERMQIFVERAKGKKDRYVMLSPVLLDILRN